MKITSGFFLGSFLLAANLAVATPPSCLATGNGYLRARIGGATSMDINWSNAEIECEGSVRPDGSGVRLSFAGPMHSDGRRMRLVFGIGSAKEGRAGKSLPTNVTVMMEGENKLFTTRGDERCTVDELQQERIGALGGKSRSYRVVGRGFCVEPASDLKGDQRIVLTRFDFAGRATYDDDIVDLASFPRTTLDIRSGSKHHRFDVWVADSAERQMQGLMFVNNLPADRGMLFVHAKPREANMWMKNTFIPLDMLFIDSNGRIAKIAAMTEPHSLANISSGVAVSAVLELDGGQAAKRSISIGDQVSWSSSRVSASR